MTTLMVNLAGVLLMAAIAWWFWLYRAAPSAQPHAGAIEILVDNGVYSPDRIRVPADQSTTLRFLRKDRSACAQTVTFADLDISAELPLDAVTEVVIPPTTPGDYGFSCQMQMYRGTLEVKAPTQRENP